MKSMNKKEIALLERAYELEIAFSVGGAPNPVLQTKSSIAERLAEQGMMEEIDCKLPGSPPVHVTGYVLTHLGRAAYCATCEGEE